MADPVVISYFENADGSGDAVINKDDIDGYFPTLLYDASGKLWCFQIVEDDEESGQYNLIETHTLDHGENWSAEAEIATDIKNTEVSAIQLPTGRILLFFWKDVVDNATKHKAYTDDHGENWTVATFEES